MRSATSSASAACCSTRSTPTPRSAAARTARRSRRTTSGARPSDSSSTRSSSRLGRERAGEREHLLLAARQQPGAAPEQRLQLGEQRRARTLHVAAAQLQVRRRVERRDHRALLGDEAEPAPHEPVQRHAGGLAQHAHVAVERRQLAREREQRRRLARAVRAEQRDDLAGRHREVEVADGGEVAVPGPAARAPRRAARPARRRARDAWRARRTARSTGSPRYAATTRGSWRISSGVPLARFRPSSSTVTRSQTRSTSATSCSTIRTASPHSSASRRTSRPSSSVSRSPRPAAGSSSSSTDGSGGDRTRDRDEAPAPVRQLVGPAVEVVLEPELADRRERGRRERVVARMHEADEVGERVAAVGRGAQVLVDGHALEQLEALERAAEPGACATARRPLAHVAAVELDTPARVDEAGDRVDQRGLARAVRADEPDDLARAQRRPTRRRPPARRRSAPRRRARRASSARRGRSRRRRPRSACAARRPVAEPCDEPAREAQAREAVGQRESTTMSRMPSAICTAWSSFKRLPRQRGDEVAGRDGRRRSARRRRSRRRRSPRRRRRRSTGRSRTSG